MTTQQQLSECEKCGRKSEVVMLGQQCPFCDKLTPLQKEIEAFEKEFGLGTTIGRTAEIKSFLRQSLVRFTRSVIEEAMPKDGENKHSVYTRCWNCLTWGISFPNNKVCGNCQSENTSEYYPDCRTQFQENVERILKDNEKEV